MDVKNYSVPVREPAINVRLSEEYVDFGEAVHALLEQGAFGNIPRDLVLEYEHCKRCLDAFRKQMKVLL